MRNLKPKPPLGPAEQIAHLEAKGLVIEDPNAAIQAIQTVGFYRFKGFALSFRNPESPMRRYMPGTRFGDVLKVRDTDNRLRSDLFTGIQQLEPMIRSAITESWCIRHGATWYGDVKHFRSETEHERQLNTWLNNFRRQASRESFVKRFITVHGPNALPPSWMLLEVITIGDLSHMYRQLRPSPEKTRIANHFGLKSTNIFEEWLHCMSHLRNVVCHHGRIWNAPFGIIPSRKSLLINSDGSAVLHRHRLAGQVQVLHNLLKAVDPGCASKWIARFQRSTNGLDDTDLANLGFSPDWHADPAFN